MAPTFRRHAEVASPQPHERNPTMTLLAVFLLGAAVGAAVVGVAAAFELAR